MFQCLSFREHLNCVSADFPEIEMVCGFLAQAAIDNPTMFGHRAAQIGTRTQVSF